MKKLFIHQPIFRLLSPLFSGIVIYLLVLLLNNNVQQIQEQFFNEELYFCIALSYAIQEFSRFLLVIFKKYFLKALTFYSIVSQIIISLSLCIAISTLAITYYFEFILGFSASREEIYVFNSIFCSITLIYILLYISHQYLYKINTDKLQQEELVKQNLEEDFKQFKKGINPNLLFESLESLIVLIKKDKKNPDDFLDHLSSIYRYILSSKEKQLVNFNEELFVLNDLISLFNYLPFRNIILKNNCKESFLIVPGSLLSLIEKIVRTTIISNDLLLEIYLKENNDIFSIEYIKNDKITSDFNKSKLKDIKNTYSIYTDRKINMVEDERIRKIEIPKLKIDS